MASKWTTKNMRCGDIQGLYSFEIKDGFAVVEEGVEFVLYDTDAEGVKLEVGRHFDPDMFLDLAREIGAVRPLSA